MRLFLCLFLLCAAGIALFVVPGHILELPPPETASPGFQWWRGSLSLFVLPALLALGGLLRMRFVSGLSLAWGLWMTILSLGVLREIPASLPGAGWNGLVFVAAVMMASLGAVVSVAMAMAKARLSTRKVSSTQNQAGGGS